MKIIDYSEVTCPVEQDCLIMEGFLSFCGLSLIQLMKIKDDLNPIKKIKIDKTIFSKNAHKTIKINIENYDAL